MASQYGWNALEKIDIDDARRLVKVIQKRKREDYRANLAIYHNSEPQKLYEELGRDGYSSPQDDEFDAVGFDILKSKMSENPRVIVKG